MFLSQADTVPPIGNSTDCPSDYEYHFSDSMCHYTGQGFPGECEAPLIWSALSQDCVLPVTSGGGGSIISMNTVLLMGAAAFVLLLLSGGRSRGSSKSSGKIYSRTSTRTLYT